MIKAYEDMINSNNAQRAYRTFFDYLLANDQENEVLLFHCTAGKDRTGFGAFLILSALGVPLSTIKQDYLLTNITTKDFVNNMVQEAKKDGQSEGVLKSIRDIQSVHPEYLDHAVSVINANYGSIHDYLRNVMKLSATDLMDLRRIYLKEV